MKKYKDNYDDFEKNIININSMFYNDINNCGYISLEDALQVIYYKITEKIFNLKEYEENKNLAITVKNFLNGIFAQAINEDKNLAKTVQVFLDDIFAQVLNRKK